MSPVYLGRNSIKCRKEKKCLISKSKKSGITSCSVVKKIIKSIFEDLKRGYTYNQKGKRIRMTKKLAKRRILFLRTLALFHGALKKELECIEKEVRKALKVLKK